MAPNISYFNPPVINKLVKFNHEKKYIEQYYNFLSCTFTKDCLTCKGEFRATDTLYKYRIKFNGESNPRVTVLEPHIEYNNDIHVYQEGYLCLHYPNDKSWTSTSLLYNTIIPWIHEWFVFYEIYLITGVWEYDFVPHKPLIS